MRKNDWKRGTITKQLFSDDTNKGYNQTWVRGFGQKEVCINPTCRGEYEYAQMFGRSR